MKKTHFAKGNLVRTVRNFRVTDDCHGEHSPPSFQPHHHVNHSITPTTHHQVVGKCSSSEAREFTGENKTGRKTLRSLGVMRLVGRVSVSAVAGLDLSTESEQLCSESSI